MKSVDLLALIIKVMSILLFMSLLKTTLDTVGLYRTGYMIDPELWSMFIFPLVYCVLGFIFFLVLWNFPVSVAQFIHPKRTIESIPDMNIEKDTLEHVIYSGIGIYLLATYIPNLAYDVLYFVFLRDTQNIGFSTERGSTESMLQIIYSFMIVAMGILLSCFSGKVKNVLRKIRERT